MEILLCVSGWPLLTSICFTLLDYKGNWRRLERGRNQWRSGLLWDTQAFGFDPEEKLMDLMTPFRFDRPSWRQGKPKEGWCNIQPMRPSTGTEDNLNRRKADTLLSIDLHTEPSVWLHVQGEFCGPAREGTISLASCNLLGLHFHLVAIGCEELFHRSIMVEGFAPMKYFGLVSRSFSHFKEIFLLFFF